MKSVFLISFLFAFNAWPCGPNEHWVRAHHRRAYVRYDGTFVSATTVRAHCQGNPPGYNYWQPRLKNDRPVGWPYKSEKTKKWTDEEIEKMLEAIGDIPSVLWENTSVNIYRMDKSSTTANNPSTHGKNIIVLYDSALDSKQNLSRFLVHEFAHDQFDHLSDEQRIDYQDLNGWVPIQKEPDDKTLVWTKINRKSVQSDSDYLPSEDFANNVEYFIFNSGTLKTVSPNAYGWIKQHYGDKIFKKGH